MKTLQKDYTTPEQSKRLLELGVPADSADMLWDGTYDLVNGWEFEDYPTFSDKHYSYYQGLYREEDSANILPCWSYGRLIKIYDLCAHGFYTLPKVPQDLIEHILSRYDWEIRNVGMDFSKLEE